MSQVPRGGQAAQLARAGALVGPATMLANVLGYLLVLLSTHRLGAARYGAFGSLLGVSLIESVPGFSLQAVVARRVAQNPDRAPFLISGAVRVTILTTIGSVAAAPAVSIFLRLGRNDGGGAAAAIVMALGVAPFMILSAWFGLLLGSEQFGRLAWAMVLAGAGRFLGLALCLQGSTSVTRACAGTVIGTVVAASVVVSGNRVRMSFGDGRPIGVLRASGALGMLLLLANLDVALARHVMTPDDAGLYAAGAIVAKAAFWLPQSIAVVVFPGLARTGGRRLLPVAAGLVVTLGAAASVTTAIVAPHLVSVVLGQRYRSVGSLLWLFASAGSALALAQLLTYADIAAGRARFTVVTAAACVVELAGVFIGRITTPVALIHLTLAVCVLVAAAGALTTYASGRRPRTSTAPEPDTASGPPGEPRTRS